MPVEPIDTLKDTLAVVLGVSPDSIDDETSVDTVAGWDSLKHLSLVLALEERFGISLTEEQSLEIISYPLVKSVLAEHGIEFSVK